MLNGKVAVVTGASRGIGRGIALALAGRGASVAVVYAGNEAAAEQVVGEARALGVRAERYRCDVADYTAAQALIAKITDDFGAIDILVNNAGITRDKLVLQMSEADFDQVLDVNLKGAYNMIKHTYKLFARQRSGRIINISSVVGIMGNAGQANYAASKAGLIGLTKAIARELASRQITCNAIAPGYIDTDMTKGLPEAAREKLVGAIPMARIGKPEDIAEMAVFLASDGAGYITGQVFTVDGGLCM